MQPAAQSVAGFFFWQILTSNMTGKRPSLRREQLIRYRRLFFCPYPRGAIVDQRKWEMLRSTWPLVLATASLMMPHPAFSGTMLKAWPHTDAPASRIREPGLPQFGRLNEYVWR